MKSTALITGASGGLGEEFARLAAGDGRDVVLVARNRERLETIAEALKGRYGVHADVLVCDLSLPGAVQTLIEELQRRNIEPDVLINNAGFGAYGLFHETSYAQERNLITVNVAALTELTKEITPGMVQQGHGMILNIASTAAFQPGPLMAVYYASKAYVMHLSLALSLELRGTGVTVTCLCPGPTETGFEKNSKMLQSRLFRRRVMDAARVARIGYRALQAGRPLVVAGKLNLLGVFMMRFVPRMLAARIARSAQAPV